MLSEFFSIAREKELTRKIERQEELDFIITKIRETEKFLNLMKKEDTSPFTDFSPKIISSSDITHKQELEKELEKHKQNRDRLESLQEESDKFIEMLEKSAERANELLKLENPDYLSPDSIKNSLTDILGYILQDPVRAKLEIENLMKKL